MFKVKSQFRPTENQLQAINKLKTGIDFGLKNQVLLGVTGSGKTFSMAKLIEATQRPTLIISHNKTLAGQLYQEMRDFFPDNAVSYFISYYDYYQPEAYLPQTDTYIEKEAQINELIEKLRLQTTANILSRDDVVVVASVSCIYNIGSPEAYGQQIIAFNKNQSFNLNQIILTLAKLQYQRTEFEFIRGRFRLRNNYLDIYPAYEDFAYRLYFENSQLKKIKIIDPISGQENNQELEKIIIYPAKHFLTDNKVFKQVEEEIRQDLKKEAGLLQQRGKLVEAERLIRRVNYDLEMIKEIGYINGIENYSRYFDGRRPGQPPFTLIDYFYQAYGREFLIIIDESHMTVPQLRGMYQGDYSRKKNLVEFGFRLKAAFDNRPLRFDEFYQIAPQIIFVSATPDDWEVNQSLITQQLNDDEKVNEIKKIYPAYAIAEQLVRPTGIPDPEIIIRPVKNEVQDLLKEIKKRIEKKEKVLVTTLTKRIAEDLANFLIEQGIRAEYLHSEIKTLERGTILDNLRTGQFDVLVGINLLREGLDLPEVSLVAILDADQEGFLRSKTSLIQTMGRAARNINGQVILYADKITGSIKQAKEEIDRRRQFQLDYNKKHKITPKTIYKPIREKIIDQEITNSIIIRDKANKQQFLTALSNIKSEGLTSYDRKKIIAQLRKRMKKEAENLNFELAIQIRDKIKELID